MRFALAILVIILTAVPVCAQDFCHRYFHYDQKYSPATFTISGITADTADTQTLNICSGGACGTTRGAGITLKGDDVGGAGAGAGIDYESGTGSTGYHSFLTAGTEKWQIEADGDLAQNVTNGGNVLIGKSGTYLSSGTVAPTSDATAAPSNIYSFGNIGLSSIRGTNDAWSSTLRLMKSRATDGTANTVIQANDGVGALIFLASDGADFENVASVQSFIDGTPGVNDVPGRLEFYTTPDGSATLTKRWTIESDGDLVQDATNGGNILLTKANTYLTSGLVPTSDMTNYAAGQVYTYGTTGLVSVRGVDSNAAVSIRLAKSRATNGTADTIVQNGDGLGSILFGGADGADFKNSAGVLAFVDGVPGTGTDMPGRLEFQTTPDGSATLATRWVIESDGDFAQNATSGGNIVLQKDGTGLVESSDAPAAAGSSITDATVLTANVTFVTGAGAAKGVKFPSAPIGGAMYHIYNTANAVLLVYPGEAGDQINAAGAGVAVSVAAYASLTCHASSASQIWCGEMANP